MGPPEEKDKPSATLPGTVEKIIKPIDPSEAEKAQINIEEAEELYRDIRVDNTLKDEKGEEVAIKEGARVDVTIEAYKKDTTKKAKVSYGFRAALWDARSSALTRRIKSSVASCWLSRRFDFLVQVIKCCGDS